MPKDGADHRLSLRDGREVFLDGAPAGDVTVHPAYRNAVGTACSLYDFQAAPENRELMTFESPTSGGRVNRCWQLPTTYRDLVERRKAIAAWAAISGGWLGRSPDHVASCMAGQVMGVHLFRAHGEARAKALVDYFAWARDNDLYLTYVIINPQADRSKDTGDQGEEHLACGVVDEDPAGITVRGAKMLGTGSIMANEVLVANIQPLKPGEEKYAISFAVPMGQRGVKVMSRRSYEAAVTTEYDYPLSAHFDENDALVYFDDVHVPWERVFIYRDTDLCRAQFSDTYAHYLQNYQAQIRLMVKMQFLVGVAHRVAETIGTVNIPHVREQLGSLAAQAAMVKGLVYGMEAGGGEYHGYFVPDRHLMYTAQVLTQDLYPRFINSIRELAGGSLIMLPSSARDFANPVLADYIGRTQKSPASGPEERVKFLHLAWDAVGSEFAGRHTQYEMFYAGAQFVTRGHSYRTYDWRAATGLVDEMLARYDLAASMGGKGAPALPIDPVDSSDEA